MPVLESALDVLEQVQVGVEVEKVQQEVELVDEDVATVWVVVVHDVVVLDLDWIRRNVT